MPSRREFLAGTAGLASTTLASTPASAASAPDQTWHRTYKPEGNPRALVHDVVALESGFALVGLAGTLSDYTCWLSRTDAAGRPQWHQTVGETGGSFLAGAPAAGDNTGVVAAGVTNTGSGPWSPSYSDPFVAQAGSTGDLSWTRTYQPALPQGGADALAGVGNGFVLAGSGSTEDRTWPWAARVDSDGTQHWTWNHDEAGA